MTSRNEVREREGSLATSVLPSVLGVWMWLHGHFSGKAACRESPPPAGPVAVELVKGFVECDDEGG